MAALERLDKYPAERWARLREGLRQGELRRGAWYPVLSVGQDVVVVVRHASVSVPQAYLEVVTTRPSRWTVLSAEHYAVCPNCAHRLALGTPPERMRCGRCRGVFELEPEHAHSAPR